MWFERFVIIATTLARDYLPSSWSFYVPTWVEIGIYLGTFGLFFTLYLLFVRVAPVVAIAEVKSILKTSGDQYVGPNATHSHHEDGHEDDHDDKATHDAHEHGHHSEKEGLAADTMHAAFAAETQTMVQDDLKKIEGIGPKVEAALNSAGIYTFSSLKTTSVEQIQRILDTADGNFGGNNPESWPVQAQLAADGLWDELEQLKDKLDGGKFA